MMLNPIVRREAQTSLRSWRIFAVITFYVLFVALIAWIYIESVIASSFYSGFNPQDIVYLYALLSGLQFGLILITVPALTAGSISGERERQTLDLLLLTKMKPFAIVCGKLLSSIGMAMLLIVATMPVYAVLFYYGGVSVVSILTMTLFVLITAFLVGSFSIFLSTVYKKTMISMVVVYLILGFLIFGTFTAYIAYVQMYLYYTGSGVNTISYVPYVYGFLSANPGAGFFSAIDAQLGTNMFNDLILLSWYNNERLPVPMWIVNPIVSIILGLVFLKLAAWKINPMRK